MGNCPVTWKLLLRVEYRADASPHFKTLCCRVKPISTFVSHLALHLACWDHVLALVAILNKYVLSLRVVNHPMNSTWWQRTLASKCQTAVVSHQEISGLSKIALRRSKLIRNRNGRLCRQHSSHSLYRLKQSYVQGISHCSQQIFQCLPQFDSTNNPPSCDHVGGHGD